jgi:hypothetical protein
MRVPPPESTNTVGRSAGQAPLFPERRAEPPRPPALSGTLRRAQEQQAEHLREREATERHSVLRGLVLLGIAVLLFSLVRAGLGRAFFTGWWRQW